jgi:hypothetical protein
MPKVVVDKPAGLRNLRLKQFVGEVLKSLPQPHTADVIEDVFLAIEANPAWRVSYDRFVYESGKGLVNAWAGFWISHAECREPGERESAARSTLLESYSKLGKAHAKRNKKMREPEALKAMHEHFLAHRQALPPEVRESRDVILALIMDGLPIESAFALALEKPTIAG